MILIKYISSLFVLLMFGSSAVADPITIQTNRAGSSEIRVENIHPNGQAELRAGNNTGCHIDVWVAGSSRSDGSNWLPNEAGMVAESPCRALHLRSNGNSNIRFSRGQPSGPIVERMRIERSRVVIHSETAAGRRGSGSEQIAIQNAAGVARVLVDGDGNVYAGSQSDDPFHLTAGGSARVTVTSNGAAEIWPSSACPGSVSPAHGGAVFCAAPNGSAWVVTPAGAVRIAP